MNRNLLLLALCQGLFMTNNVVFMAINGLVGLSLAPLGWMATLPITGLAEASNNPENFIGIHFFSPVDKMGLVEIIMGAKTSDTALAKAIDYIAQIRKTPIVVNDSRGFYTSRCFGTYVSEGIRMLSEGIKPALIENAGKQVGMPVAPLAMNDEVALDLAYKVRAQTKEDLGDKYEETSADVILEEMVIKRGRLGRKNGKGFYDYTGDGDPVPTR